MGSNHRAWPWCTYAKIQDILHPSYGTHITAISRLVEVFFVCRAHVGPLRGPGLN